MRVRPTPSYAPTLPPVCTRGSYFLRFGPTTTVGCLGVLEGFEEELGRSPSQAGLVEGRIDIVPESDAILVSGEALMAGFDVDSLELLYGNDVDRPREYASAWSPLFREVAGVDVPFASYPLRAVGAQLGIYRTRATEDFVHAELFYAYGIVETEEDVESFGDGCLVRSEADLEKL